MTNPGEDTADVAAPQPQAIDEGCPQSRDAWPDGVLDSLRRFSQGDVIERPPLFYYADPRYPIWARTREYQQTSTGPEVIVVGPEASPPYGIITSQTCDIAEEDADEPIRPWVQMCPVYDRSDLNSGTRRLLRDGKGSRHLLHLPNLTSGFWIADLRIEYPVEKGWLAQQRPIDAFADEVRQRIVGSRVAALRSRPAFGREFGEAVQRPLVDRLRELRRNDTAFYQRMDLQVDGVAVELDSLLNPTQARISLLTEGDLDEDIRAWWESWWDAAVPEAWEKGITLQAFTSHRLDQLTVAEYRRMTIVPLERVSPY